MCGIAGVDADDGVDRDALVRMQRCLEHRGPDDSGVYVDGTTGLAHRRLSIVGVDSGQQPITNEDGSVVVVFNGEIYNFPELRQQLRADGHRFETDTDTEVLVHLYEDHGDALVDRIDGMFAFALWDADAERLLLARDRMGIKPLLLATDGRTRAFASELDPLFETDVDLGGIDRTALAAYFALGYVPAPRTVFRNVRKLEPGHLAVVSDGELRTRQFYSPSVRPRDPGFDAACEELAGRVRDAVERRLMADVPLGAFLSGGIDSSIVVALMAELQTDPVETFTVGFERERFDETWAAREVAEYYGTDHHEFTVTVDDLRGTAPELFTRMGEPFADPSLLPTYAVAR
ncbi:MAG: asparagine synthase (glutamine-hydrolyzing), partial [Salinirussus sp.]